MAQNLKELVKKNKKYIKEEVNLNELLDKFILQKQLEPFRGTRTFHPSQVSKGIECEIYWYYFFKNEEEAPEKWSDESLTAMINGKGIHNAWQEVLWEMGILEGVWKCPACGYEFWATAPHGQCENCRAFFKSWDYIIFKEVPIQAGLIKGHADGLINNGGPRILLELKSIKNQVKNSPYGFEVLTTKPLDDHFLQTQLYLWGWNEMAKKAPLGEEIIVDNDGKLSVEKLDAPVYQGAKVIGQIHTGLIEYIAKNSSEKKSFAVKRNQTAIDWLLDSMAIIWKAYLEDTPETLNSVEPTMKSKCKYCKYRKMCSAANS